MTRFAHISGDRALDLLNTVDWRLSETDREEQLTGYDGVLDWCRESGLITPREHRELAAAAGEHPRVAERERLAAIELREAAYRALVEHETASAQQVADACREALADARLERVNDEWSWRTGELTLATPRHRIGLALTDLMRRDDLDRLHQCEDVACGWVYLDTSPRRNRRWCVAKDCGDRNRSRAYYARKTRGRGA